MQGRVQIPRRSAPRNDRSHPERSEGSALALLGACLLIAGCASLDVTNTDAPDIDRVLSSPAIEQAIAGGYLSCHNAIEVGDALNILDNLSVENGGAVLPPASVNSRAGAFSATAGSGGDFLRLSIGGRVAARTLDALDQLIAGGGTLGSKPQDARGRAFLFFAIGCHQGWLAMIYDSAGIVTQGMPKDFVPPLSDAHSVMDDALEMLDSAIDVASAPVAAQMGGFPLPSTWVNGQDLSLDNFVRMTRSLRARFRAGVARTPTERGLVDWPAVLADVNGGITADFTVTVGGTSGWSTGFGGSMPSGGGTNSSMTYFYYGMADTSRAFDTWLATPLDQRSSFVVVTPDRRWPQGTTRAQQQANSANTTSLASRPYVSHKTVADPIVAGYALSFYYFNRLSYLRGNANGGPFPAITKAEMDLLAAEAELRAGNVTAAAQRIDVTRVARGQLPAITGVVTATGQPVPGSGACVPRVPVGPAFTSTQCGDIWDALKWEKRMETAFTGFAQWYFDSRGWGDLFEGTAIELPVPSYELAARRKADYSLGGGFPRSAPKGTYGY